MKVLLKIGILVLMVLSSKAQSFDYLGGISLGDGEGDDDESQEIAFFSNGDLLVAGSYKGLIDFDPDPNSLFLSRSNTAGREVWIARYSDKGDLIWWQTISSKRNINVYDIFIDGQENFYVTGSYLEEAIFESSTGGTTLLGVSPNDADGYVAKFSSSGNFFWAQRFAGTGIDNGVAMDINSQGHLALLGVFGDSLQFDPNQSNTLRISAGAGDVFFAAFDTANGQLQWVESIAGVGFDNPRDFVIDSQGNYYILGDYTSTITFRLNPLSALVSSGGNDVFLAKYNTNRQFLWAKKIAGSSTDLASGLELYADTLLVVSGTFRGNVQLDPNGIQAIRTGNGFNADIFLVALDTSAQYQWGHVFGESSTDQTNGLSIDQSGTIWMGGYFVNTIDFDPDPINTFNLNGSGGDALLAGYRLSDGSFVNAFQIGGTSFSQSLDVGVAPNNKIWSVGPIYLSADFDPSGSGLVYTTPSSGNSNSFFAAYTATQFDTAWVSQDREGGNDVIRESLFLADGSIVSCGYFEGGIDADPGNGQNMLTSAGSSDIFFARYDANFNLIWAQSLGGINTDYGSALGVDSSGNIYLGGYYFGTLYFDNNGVRDSIVSSSSSASFLAKYNAQGQLQWMQNIDGSSDDYLYDLSINAAGEVAVTGYFRATISFDNGGLYLSAANRAAFLAVFDSTGSLKWSEKIDGPSNEYGYACLAARNGNFYIGGSYRNTVDFDPSSGSDSYTSQAGGNDVFISSFSATGSYQWTKVYGNSGFETAWDLAEDAHNNVYVAGDFFNIVNFNPGHSGDSLQSSGDADVFLLSLKADGTFRWVKQLGGSQNDGPRSLKVLDNEVYHAGYFMNSADLDPSPNFQWANSSQQTIYLQVLDTLGNFIKAQHFGGLIYDEAWSVDHFQGETLLSGTFQIEVDFDPDSLNTVNYISKGDQDAFIVKLGTALNCPPYTDTLQISACNSFTWRNQTYSQSGWYTQAIANPGDCDSLLSLNLTILPSYDSLLTVAACDSFVWRGQTYYQSGSFYDSLSSQNACDSIFRLQLNLDYAFADTLQISTCDNYNWRGQTYTQSGWYYDSLSTTKAGCDSIYVLQLNLDYAFADTLQISTCDNYSWRGQTYTQSGWYYDSLSSTQAGCDSIYALNLSITGGSLDTLFIQACDSINLAGRLIRQSGVYRDTLSNALGCDSILVYQVQIDSLDLLVASNGFTASAQQSNAVYQWLNCDNGYQIIPTANSQNFDPFQYQSSNGNYAVRIEYGSCIDTSDCVYLQNISLNEWKLGKPKLWPNPSDGLLNIEMPEAAAFEVEILDAQGRLIERFKIPGNTKQSQISLPNAKGAYLLRIRNSAGAYWQETVIRN